MQGLSTYYETQGDGDAIILLHGWGADSNTMRPLLKFLKNNTQKLKVISMDFPGFGLSDLPPAPWGINDYAQHLLSFMDGLGIPAAILLGHSFGGRVAIKFAAFHLERVKKLILVDSAGIIPKRGINYYSKVLMAKTIKYINFALQKIGTKMPFVKKIGSNLGSEDYKHAGKMRGTFVKVVNQDLKEFMPLIKSQTLLIWGDKDESTPLQDAFIMKTLIPNSSLLVIKGAGHFSFLDNFDSFTKALLPFLGDYA